MINALKSLLNLSDKTGLKRYAGNVSWLMADQILRLISGIFVGIWVARYLGPEKFGLFSYVIAFTAIFGAIVKIGLDAVLVRELVNRPRECQVYLGSAFWMRIGAGLTVLAAVSFILPFTSNGDIIKFYILVVTSSFLFQSFEVIDFYFQSRVLAKIPAICRTIQLTISSALKIFLVLSGADLFHFVMVVAFDALSLAVTYLIAYRLFGPVSFYRYFSPVVAKQLLSDSWPLIGSALVVMLYMRIDQLMIKEMLGARELGLYSASVRVSEGFYFIPAALTAALFPAILNAKNADLKLYKQRLQRLYTFLFWISLIIAIPASLYGNQIIALLFGASYEEAGAIFSIHIWLLVFVAFFYVSGKWLVSENITILSLQRNAVAAVLNVMLNLTLIPTYGLSGAAVASLLAFAFSSYLFDLFSAKTREQFILKSRSLTFKI